MPEPEPGAGKFNLQIGTVTGGQVIVGDYNTVSQRIGLTPAETDELRSLFTDLRSGVSAGAPAKVQPEAEVQVAELEAALVSEEPDPGRVRRVLRWFRENAPQLAGAVVSVIINPLVGKVVEGAGSAIADRFREVIADET
jgi:hypothetical protein